MGLKLADYKTDLHNDWCPGCVLPDTLIHWNTKVKQIKQISEGDVVLGRDGRFHKVSEVLNHIHRGKIFKLVTKCFGETYLTPEHPVLIVKHSDRNKKLHNTKYNAIWVRADEVETKDYMVYPIQKEEEDRKYIVVDYQLREKDTISKELPTKILLDARMLRLMGYYVSEGYVHKRQLGFTFNSKEGKFVKDVKSIMMKIFGLKATINTKRNATTITFYSAPLARLFLGWFGHKPYNKRLPNFVMLLPAKKQRELIKGLWRGDDWINTRQSRANFRTASEILCEQVKTLLLRQGVIPVISVSKAYGVHRESYSIQVVNDRDFVLCKVLDKEQRLSMHVGKPPSSIVLPDYVLIPVKKIESFDYNGSVYNLEVDDVNSYVSENATLHNCGDFGILNAIQMTLADLQIPPHNVAVFSGIGCSGKTPHYIKVYGIHTLHGRVLPYATGAKLANPDLEVIAVGGDGDGLGIGAGHFVNIGRRNVDMMYVIYDNAVYGLTKGQASPTLKLGLQTKSLPKPNVNQAVNPIMLALASGFTFIARAYSFDIKHMKGIMKRAIQHKGLAFVDVLQPCPTYNDIQTKDWFSGLDRKDEEGMAMPRVYKLEEEDYDPRIKNADDESELSTKMLRVIEKSHEWRDRIPIGIFYQNEHIPCYEDRINARNNLYRKNPPARQIIENGGRPITNISKLLDVLAVSTI